MDGCDAYKSKMCSFLFFFGRFLKNSKRIPIGIVSLADEMAFGEVA
jgi:hypothetical protein